MREKLEENGLILRAIAANNAVMLSWNVRDPSLLKGVLGFAVHREETESGKKFYLRSSKAFPSPPDAKIEGKKYNTTYQCPIQSFSWSDYTVSSDIYSIYPMSGPIGNLTKGDGTSLKIQTESGIQGKHSIFFNRGVAGSQGYSRKFGNQKPEDVADRAAFQWLSNGLEEALFAFINQAKDSTYSLRVAAYEFCYEPFLEALKAAHERGVDVKIIVDWKVKKDGTFKVVKGEGKLDHVEESAKAIAAVGLPKEIIIERRAGSSYISHNKFLVLFHENEAKEVWTGSTNFTPGGIFGQSNNGHIVRDSEVAQHFADYWTRLSLDPPASELRKTNVEFSPLPTEIAPNSCHLLFSPRSTDDALDFYTELLTKAKHSILFTAAFGVNDHFTKALKEKSESVLRYILLEKSDKQTKELEDDPCNRIAVGSVLDEAAAELLGYEAEQLSGLNEHVSFIHTKYLLIDPFSNDPIVICGSANFSRASNINNDENMMLVRGDTRLADQYAVHFMRLWHHFHFRYRARGGHITQEDKCLVPDDSWQLEYVKEGSVSFLERNMFCPLQEDAAAAAALQNLATIVIDHEEMKKHRPEPRKPKARAKKSDLGPIGPEIVTGRFCTLNEDGTLSLVFPYSKNMVEKVKTIPQANRAWIPDLKKWKITIGQEKESIRTVLEESKFVFDEGSSSVLLANSLKETE